MAHEETERERERVSKMKPEERRKAARDAEDDLRGRRPAAKPHSEGEKTPQNGHGHYLVTDSDGHGHLPVEKDGKLSHRLMGAAWAALHGGYNDLTPPSLTNTLVSGAIFIIGQPETCVDGQNIDGQSGKGNADCSASLFPLTVFGNGDSGWAGDGDLTLAGNWGSGGQLNESIQFGGGGSSTAGFGEDYGSSIQHPISWAYIGDPVAAAWYDKLNSSTPISGSPGAFVTGNGGDPPYGAWDWIGEGFCFSGNAACLSEPAGSGTVALSGANGSSRGTISISSATSGTATFDWSCGPAVN